MNWHEYPLLRVLFVFLGGIVSYHFFPQAEPFKELLAAFIFIILIFVVFSSSSSKISYRKHHFRGILIYIALGIFAYSLAAFQNPYQKKDYYKHYLNKSSYLSARLIEEPEEKENSVKLIVEIEKCYHRNKEYTSQGKAILYLQKDSIKPTISYGSTIVIANNLKAIAPPGNPKSFDFKQYMYLQGIQYQAYLKSQEWDRLPTKVKKGWVYYSLRVRSFLMEIMKEQGIEGDEYAIVSALLLGQREFLSEEMQQTYSGVGAIHVLCVSGLHVGMIFLVLNTLLRFLDRKRNGRLIRLFIVLIALWFYAFMTGLSPSVLRATTMFSFVSIGSNLNRKTHIYNSLSVSAIFLLIIDPNLLFQLGFQLSYAAVWTIVAFQPLLYKLWTPKTWIIDKTWALVCVSITAQIGTLPLSLYYFHQFPNYFILTNIIVIPAAWLIIHLGFLVLIFSFVPLLNILLTQLLIGMVKALNYSMKWIADLPFSLTSDIPMCQAQMIMLYLLILLLGIGIIQKKKAFVKLSLLIVVFISLLGIGKGYQAHNNTEIIVYQQNKGLAISAMWGKEHYLLGDSSIYDEKAKHYAMHNYWVSRRTCNPTLIHLHDKRKDSPMHYPFLQFLEKRFVIIDDSIRKMNTKTPLQVDYLILQSSKAREPHRYINMYRPQKVIIAANVYQKTQQVWQSYLDSVGIEYWDIKQQGAFILK